MYCNTAEDTMGDSFVAGCWEKGVRIGLLPPKVVNISHECGHGLRASSHSVIDEAREHQAYP